MMVMIMEMMRAVSATDVMMVVVVMALFLQLLLLTLMVVVIVDGRGCSTTGGTLILVLLTQAMCTLFPKLCCACPGNDACHHLRAFRASGDRTRGAMPCCALFFHHFAPF